MDLKARYSIIFTSFFAMLLAMFSSLVFVQVRNRLVGGAEQTLVNHLEHESRHLDHPHGPAHSPSPTSHHRDISQRVWKDGTLIDDSFSEEMKSVSADSLQSNAQRLVRRLQARQGSNVYEIVAYYDLTSTLDYLSALQRTLLIGCLIALGLIIPMSLWLMKMVLAPFRSLSDSAASLTAKSLSFRFPEARHLDEYGRLVKSFNLLFDRLESSFRQISVFATNASHELRTPLAVIIGQAERARRRRREAGEYEAVLDKILFRAKSLKGIANRLLALADIEREEQQTQSSLIAVVAAVQEVVDSLLFTRNGVQKEVKVVADGEVNFYGSQELFLCLVNNLVENAVKYGREKVLVSVSNENERIRLLVEDDGPGIPLSERQRVFEPFYQSTNIIGKKEGHGLGLSIAKACVESLQGEVVLGDSVLGGLLATVTLPKSVSGG